MQEGAQMLSNISSDSRHPHENHKPPSQQVIDNLG